MGKKRVDGKRKVKNKKISENKRFQVVLKNMQNTVILSNIDNLGEYSHDVLSKYINLWKELVYDLDEDFINLVDTKYPFIDFINYLDEGMFLYKEKKRNSKEVSAFLKEKVRGVVIENNYTLELLVCLGRIQHYFSQITSIINPKFYGLDSIDAKLLISIGNLLFTAVMYVSIGIVKFANKRIKKMEFLPDGKLGLEYTKEPLLTLKDLSRIEAWFRDELDNEDILECRAILFEINIYYFEFIPTYFDNPFCREIVDEGEDVINIDSDSIQCPLLDENNRTIISSDDIIHMYSKRKYLYPKAGIVFDIKDSTSDISKIRMIEDSAYIHLLVSLKNRGNIYNSYRPSNNEKIRGLLADNSNDNRLSLYDKDVLNIKIRVSKMLLKIEAAAPSVVVCDNNVQSNANVKSRFNQSLMLISLSCVYIAYCKPKMFQKSINIYGVTCSSTGIISKARHFKVAYIRRLPKGQKMSEDAKKKALSDGFENIPTGYTFVSCSNKGLEDLAKAKKIEI